MDSEPRFLRLRNKGDVPTWTCIPQKGDSDFTFPGVQGSLHQPAQQSGRAGNPRGQMQPRKPKSMFPGFAISRRLPGVHPVPHPGHRSEHRGWRDARHGPPEHGKGPRCPSPHPERLPRPQSQASVSCPEARPPPRTLGAAALTRGSPGVRGHRAVSARLRTLPARGS